LCWWFIANCSNILSLFELQENGLKIARFIVQETFDDLFPTDLAEKIDDLTDGVR
jgi:hypothetical protein